MPIKVFGIGQLSLFREVCSPSVCKARIIWPICVCICIVGRTRVCRRIEVLVFAASCSCCSRNFKKDESKLGWFKFFCKVIVNDDSWVCIKLFNA